MELIVDLPVAVLPQGSDPATFYGLFDNKFSVALSQALDLVIWVDADPELARIYAPVKSAVRFYPSGRDWNGNTIATDSLILQVWPLDYVKLKETLTSALPAVIQIENVDAAEVRNAIRNIFTALGRDESALTSFMSGDGLCKVNARTPLGIASAGIAPPSSATPNRVSFRFFDGTGQQFNPIPFLNETADSAGLDKTIHPLLRQLELEGWIEVLILSETNDPVPNEAFTLYFADGSSRTGVTNQQGRIYETAIPPGPWGIDFPNYPSFQVIPENA